MQEKTAEEAMVAREVDKAVGNHEVEAVSAAVIGGGPAGVGACLALAQKGAGDVCLFESDDELGGIPRSCGPFFGMRDLKRLYSGPVYARRLASLVAASPARVRLRTTVVEILPFQGENGEHVLKAISPRGVIYCKSRHIILATGCFEASRQKRMLPGDRPAGIFTTRQLQEYATLRKRRIGTEAVVIGSEYVALSCALLLRRHNIRIRALIEEEPSVRSNPPLFWMFSRMLGFPVYTDCRVQEVRGPKRVSAVNFTERKSRIHHSIPCDTLVVTGRFEANRLLMDPLEKNPESGSIAVHAGSMTCIDRIYAVGNVAGRPRMHDRCFLEGRACARGINRMEANRASQSSMAG